MALRTHRCAIQHQGFPEGKGARGAKKPLDDEMVRRSGAAGAGAMCVCACVGGRNDWLVLACGSQLCVTTVLQHHTLRAFMAAHIHTHTRTQKARPYTIHNTQYSHTHTRARASTHAETHTREYSPQGKAIGTSARGTPSRRDIYFRGPWRTGKECHRDSNRQYGTGGKRPRRSCCRTTCTRIQRGRCGRHGR